MEKIEWKNNSLRDKFSDEELVSFIESFYSWIKKKRRTNWEIQLKLWRRSINEIIVWTFVSFDRKNNQYRVNIRSRGPVINEIAASFGGGGHKFASGVRTDSKEVIDKLLVSLSNCCKEYKEGANKNGSN